MAAKKKVTKLSNCAIYLTICSIVTVLIGTYVWHLYGRIVNKQISQSTFLSWLWIGQSSSTQNNLTTEALLNAIQEDIEYLKTLLTAWICLLVPRETTSVISAIILVILAIFTCSFSQRPKSQKKDPRQRIKKVEKRENDNQSAEKSASNNVFKSFTSSVSSTFYASWTYLFPRTKHNTFKSLTSSVGSTFYASWTYLFSRSKHNTCKHYTKNEDEKCICHACQGYQPIQHQNSILSRLTFSKIFMVCLICAFMMSIPWEYIRLFQIEVAKRMAVMEKGVPKECYPDKMTITESIRYWLLLQLSWQHDPCEKYHKAILVDPLWEITPLMVISSVITRSLLHPIEIFFSTVGKSFRHFFSEIPGPWQPIMLIVMVIFFILTITMVCGYRITLPMFLKIEPKTPVFGRIRSLIIHDSDSDQGQQPPNLERKRLKYTDE